MGLVGDFLDFLRLFLSKSKESTSPKHLSMELRSPKGQIMMMQLLMWKQA